MIRAPINTTERQLTIGSVAGVAVVNIWNTLTVAGHFVILSDLHKILQLPAATAILNTNYPLLAAQQNEPCSG